MTSGSRGGPGTRPWLQQDTAWPEAHSCGEQKVHYLHWEKWVTFNWRKELISGNWLRALQCGLSLSPSLSPFLASCCYPHSCASHLPSAGCCHFQLCSRNVGAHRSPGDSWSGVGVGSRSIVKMEETFPGTVTFDIAPHFWGRKVGRIHAHMWKEMFLCLCGL